MWVFLLVVATSYWVYFDAKKAGIQKGLTTGFFNIGPTGWFLGCILLWIVIFPLYLIKRSKLRKLAAESKMDPKRTSVVEVLALAVIGFFALLVVLANIYAPTTVDLSKAAPASISPGHHETEKEYIASTNKISFDRGDEFYYKELLKNPDRFSGKRLAILGKVMSIEEDSGETLLQVYISRDYDVVIVHYPGTVKAYEDDMVWIYGEGRGRIEGTNAIGAVMTWPAIEARHIRLKSEAEKD